MDVHWYKEGMELRETHQTIIKSFGRTHILVFVNTMPQDAGVVTFLVGRSKTSSQLRVKGRISHQPDSRTSSFMVAFGSDQHLLFYTSCWFWFFGFSCQTLSTQLSSCRADQHRTCKRCTFIMGSSSGHPEKSSIRICARTTGNGHRFTGMAAVPDHRHRDFCGNPR